MATQTRALTADDVLDLPPPENGIGWELVDGKPVPVMTASLVHGQLIIEVGYRLSKHVRENKLPGRVYSDSGTVLNLRDDPERMRGPDVMYVENRRLEGVDPERIFRGLPDLAIEIDLTSAKKPGGHQRIVDYMEAGVRLVWAIDPHSRSAMAFRPDGSARLYRADETLDAAEVVPGFRLSLAELFASAEAL